MTELKMEPVLMLAIAAFALYYIMVYGVKSRCSRDMCSGNGFNVGGISLYNRSTPSWMKYSMNQREGTQLSDKTTRLSDYEDKNIISAPPQCPDDGPCGQKGHVASLDFLPETYLLAKNNLDINNLSEEEYVDILRYFQRRKMEGTKCGRAKEVYQCNLIGGKPTWYKMEK